MENKKGEEARHESRFGAKEGFLEQNQEKGKRTRGGCRQRCGGSSEESRQRVEEDEADLFRLRK